jgi:hypothetical protein
MIESACLGKVLKYLEPNELALKTLYMGSSDNGYVFMEWPQ